MASLHNHNDTSRVYFHEEIEKHKTRMDAWIILFGRVLDITSFLSLHPREADVFLPFLGKDATKAYLSIGHSLVTISDLMTFAIGDYGDEDKMANNFETASSTAPSSERSSVSCSSLSKGENMSRINSASTPLFTLPMDTFDFEKDIEEMTTKDKLLSQKNNYVIDFDKPLMSQICLLGKEDYFKLINHPNCTSKVLRMFEWDLFEFLSKTQWYVIPSIYLPLCLLLLLWGFSIFHNTYAMSLVLFATGIFIWSLSEYVFHRFLFHLIEHYLPDNPICISLHFALHAVHHLLPKDPLRLVMPPALLAVFLFPFILFTINFVPSNCAFPLWSGIIGGYLAYDMIHYSSHHFSYVDKLPHLREMKIYHMKHHFKDSTKGFGVSTKIWDFVFGTVIA